MGPLDKFLLQSFLLFLHSGIVYKFQCGGYNATSILQTLLHFKVRMCEHLGISTLDGKRAKGDEDSTIKGHLLFFSYMPDSEDFSIVTMNNNNFKVNLIVVSLLINREHCPLL